MSFNSYLLGRPGGVSRQLAALIRELHEAQREGTWFGLQGAGEETGISFTWEGAREYDQMSGTGRVTLGKDGRLKGTFRIKDGDSSSFVAVRAEEPDEPIAPPPRYRDKWRSRW